MAKRGETGTVSEVAQERFERPWWRRVSGQILQTVANVFAIIAGIAAVATFILLVFDRRTRIKLGFRIDDRERVAGEGRVPYAVFEVGNRGRKKVLVLRHYLVLNSRGDRFYDFDAGPGESGYELIPDHPPGETWVRMATLAQVLIDAGAVFTAQIKFVVEDANGNRHELTVVVHDLQEWAKGRNPKKP